MTTETIYVQKDDFAGYKPRFVAKLSYEICRHGFKHLGKRLPKVSPIRNAINRFDLTFRLTLARLGYLGQTKEHQVYQIGIGNITTVIEARNKRLESKVASLQDRNIEDFAKANPRILLLFIHNFMKEAYDVLIKDMILKEKDPLTIKTFRLKIAEFIRIIRDLKNNLSITEMDNLYEKVTLCHSFMEISPEVPIDRF